MKKFPIGKGLWIWMLYRLLEQYGSFEAAAKEGKANGIKWVAIKAQDGPYIFNQRPIINAYGKTVDWIDDLIGPAIAAFKAEGILVWLWGYNYGYLPEKEVEAMDIRLKEFGDQIEGWIWDAEAEMKAGYASNWAVNQGVMADKVERSKKMVQGIKNLYPEVSFGFTSYRYPKVHNDFPWRPWMAHADFYVPQVFHEGAHNPVYQLDETIKQYRAEEGKWGITAKVIVPSGAAYTGSNWYSTPEDILAFGKAVVERGYDAYNYWEWHIAATKSNVPGQMLQAVYEAPQTKRGEEVADPGDPFPTSEYPKSGNDTVGRVDSTAVEAAFTEGLVQGRKLTIDEIKKSIDELFEKLQTL